MKGTVTALLIFGVAMAALLVFAQSPFAASAFEYQQYRDYRGVLVDWPYPMLISGTDRYLLVDPGKHGASIDGLVGRTVVLSGALIHRGSDRMIELQPGSLRAVGDAAPVESAIEFGEFTFTGEIVDSKCYLGVMNPGSGKVHRDCAVRCISGGIPPAFLVRDAAGESRVLLLKFGGATSLPSAILEHIAEPMRLSGRLSRAGSTLIFTAELSSLHRE